MIYKKDTSFVLRFLQYRICEYKLLAFDMNQLVCPDSVSIFHLYYLVLTGVI